MPNYGVRQDGTRFSITPYYREELRQLAVALADEQLVKIIQNDAEKIVFPLSRLTLLLKRTEHLPEAAEIDFLYNEDAGEGEFVFRGENGQPDMVAIKSL